MVTFVQSTTGTKEVMNAHYMDLPDTATGVYEDETTPVSGSAQLLVGPNPTSGYLSIGALLPDGVTGTVSIYDMQGRIIDSFDAVGPETEYLDETGVYFVRLETSSGEVVTRRCTVID